jgi:hypothetical protein
MPSVGPYKIMMSPFSKGTGLFNYKVYVARLPTYIELLVAVA